MTTKAQLQARNAQLEAELKELSQDKAYGGLTRPALEIEHRKHADKCQYVVFADLNKVHELNAEHGQDKMDEMIRTAFSFTIRDADVILFGRWKSGDEIAFLVSGNPDGFIARLHNNLHDNGLSAIADYAKLENHDLIAAVKIASDKVFAAKKARGITSR
jgi:hypothetical protein